MHKDKLGHLTTAFLNVGWHFSSVTFMIQLNWQRSHWVIKVKMLGDRCLRQSWVAEEKNFFGNQRKILRQPRSSGGFFGFETSLIEVCRSSCLQMRLQIVANHQMVWVNPLSISSFDSMFRLVLIENDISLWFLLTIHSVTQPRTSGWPRIRISSGEILACRRVQCFCVRLKRNWGGEGEDMLCLFSPSRLCPDLSNSVQLSRKNFVQMHVLKLKLSRTGSQVQLDAISQQPKQTHHHYTACTWKSLSENREDLQVEWGVYIITRGHTSGSLEKCRVGVSLTQLGWLYAMSADTACVPVGERQLVLVWSHLPSLDVPGDSCCTLCPVCMLSTTAVSRLHLVLELVRCSKVSGLHLLTIRSMQGATGRERGWDGSPREASSSSSDQTGKV